MPFVHTFRISRIAPCKEATYVTVDTDTPDVAEAEVQLMGELLNNTANIDEESYLLLADSSQAPGPWEISDHIEVTEEE